jgi:hypothetical protein
MALLRLKDSSSRPVLSFFTLATGEDFDDAPQFGSVDCTVPRLPLAAGQYTISVTLRVGRTLTDRVEDVAVLEVLPGDFFGTGFDATRVGPVLCDHRWSISDQDGTAPAASASAT